MEALSQVPNTGAARKSVKDRNDDVLRRFNDPANLTGANIRAVLLTAEQHSEGVSLFGVRRIIIASLCPGRFRPRWDRSASPRATVRLALRTWTSALVGRSACARTRPCPQTNGTCR